MLDFKVSDHIKGLGLRQIFFVFLTLLFLYSDDCIFLFF